MLEYIDRKAALDALFYSLEETARRIEAIHAADVAPVVHGHWVKHGDYCTCSECGNSGVSRLNYCSNCGAKMDKEDN